jgi:hypothetical protein
MRRAAASAVGLLLLGAAACSDGAGTRAQVDSGAPTADVAAALATAQAAMPIEVSNSRVRVLLRELCGSGAAGTDAAIDQVGALTLADAGQADGVLAALDAGTAKLCPGDVDPSARSEVAAAAKAAVPAVASTPAAADSQSSGASPVAGTSGTGSTGSGSSNSAAAGGGTPGSSNSSSGEAVVGGGNATGSGNQSSTGFTQSVGSGSATNSNTAG